METLLGFVMIISFICIVVYGIKLFRHHGKNYKNRFFGWIVVLIVAIFIDNVFPTGGSSHQSASHHSAPAKVAYHNNGNPTENYAYFKSHAIHKFSDWATNHPADSSDITTPMGVHWSSTDDGFVIDTGADAHSTADKHTQAYASFKEFKQYMKKYQPLSKKQWDGTVVFQDNYGDTITTSNMYNKHLDDNGMGFDGDED